MRSTRYQVPVCTRVLVFLLSLLIVLPLGPLRVFFRISHPYCRAEHDIANEHTAQHKAISSAQVALGIIKSLVAPNHGPLLAAPSALSCILPCASVAGSISRPRSGALVTIQYDISLFYNNISRTSAVSSTNFGSILIFASCIVGTRNILCG